MSRKEKLAAARHEAAHAVVGVRLGLPIVRTDIISRTIHGDDKRAHDQSFRSTGLTAFADGTVDGLVRALQDPQAVAGLEMVGAQVAAGVVAEFKMGATLNDPANREDLQALVQLAAILGLGTSTADEDVRDWIHARLRNAEDFLMRDDGAAWDRVTRALYRKRALTRTDLDAMVAPLSEFEGSLPG